MPAGEKQADASRCECFAGLDELLAFAEISTAASDEIAHRHRLRDADGLSFPLDLFLHHHGVRAGWQRSAGKDAHGLARADVQCSRLAGGLFPHEAQCSGVSEARTA